MNKQEKIELRRFFEWANDLGNKSCKNCQWSGYVNGEKIITCGHHIGNFLVNSSCGSWTNPSDVDLIKSQEKAKQRIKKKISNN